ncbi:MAG: hypothetical protein EPN43_02380 [Jatrophihabitans sp.]|nr:MAG: hypothetical protein EPN43_02380 [Jatrophihabitans sp.]
MEFPVPVRRAVTLVDDGRYDTGWRPALERAGVLLLEVDTAGVHGADEFFARAAAALALPAGTRIGGWSGLEDYLRQQVATWPREAAMIVMRRVEDMARGCLGDLLEAVSVLRDLVVAAESDAQNFPNDVAVRVALTGSGPSFPDG